jgi:lipopolysaccharide export system permease protein
MKILDRYLLREFLRTFLGILLVLSVILVLKEVLRRLTSIVTEAPALRPTLLFFVYALPSDIVFAVPTTVILAIMFSLGSMAKRKEILAIHSSGVSYTRIALPLAGALVLITAGLYACGEWVVPVCQERAYYIQRVVFEGKDSSVLTRNHNITTKGVGNRFYTMSGFDSATNTMDHPTITDRSDDGRTIQLRIDAETAQLVDRDADGQWQAVIVPQADHPYSWDFRNAVRIDFGENGTIHREQFDRIQIPMEDNLNRFLATNKNTDQMSAGELHQRSQVESQRSPGGDQYLKYVTNLHYRLAFPAATLLLGLIGYTLAVRSSIRSLVFEFGMALVAIGAYYALLFFMQKMGRNGVLPPVLALWAPNALFLCIALWRFHELERVPRK